MCHFLVLHPEGEGRRRRACHFPKRIWGASTGAQEKTKENVKGGIKRSLGPLGSPRKGQRSVVQDTFVVPITICAASGRCSSYYLNSNGNYATRKHMRLLNSKAVLFVDKQPILAARDSIRTIQGQQLTATTTTWRCISYGQRRAFVTYK